jgi:MoxR-like ATPase
MGMENLQNHEMHRTEQLRIIAEKIAQEHKVLSTLKSEISKKIIGQQALIDRLIIALLANGHILLEGVPGLAKTLAIKTLSEALNGTFNRIQFTPDLLPADLTGTQIYQQKAEKFVVKKGPIFASFVLADEINRAPAKVQSALLEAMQERQVTIGEESFELPKPFMVMATQNPIEQEGTYPLPEAQVDRFMMKVNIGYPSKSEELSIIRNQINPNEIPAIQSIINLEDIERMRNLVSQIYMDEKVENYIVSLIFATRYPKENGMDDLSHFMNFGASPRGSINLALTARAHAFLKGRAFVIPDDVQAMAADVLKHRIGLTYEAEVANLNAEDIIQRIIARVEVP